MGKALVTGAGRRIGRAMALYLADQGHDVVVHFASSAEEANDVVAQIRAKGRIAEAVQADLTSEDATQQLVAKSVAAIGGPLTVLVNNASIFEYDDISTATRVLWDRHLETNLRAPFVLTQHFAAQAPEAVIDALGEPQAQALVVNMIDQRVRNLTPDFMTYTIAKMGLWAFTQTAAQGLAPKVRVNAIGPGPTLQGAHQTVQDFAAERQKTLLKRGASLADINAALGYFLHAPSVTGQLLCVDAGQHLA
ncbi:MAG: NAD(P)-dependent dehydrogenase (short-subunit alcohol dehydrogenase family) [Paracoccaceae bacterium]|jgi:NAD(P)-dependent dehydrogenase (short-subunit alcohol dehydrogenase family)